MSGVPTHCIFQHPVVTVLDGVVFRRSEGDNLPAMALKLDGIEAVIPLDAVAKLFGMEPDSADGTLLTAIAQALRFVPALRPGDPLPSEVVTGEASWEPTEAHRQVATARLQMQLLSWIGGRGGGRIASSMLADAGPGSAPRAQVDAALRHAAAELGVGGGPAVAALIEELASELAYIEALRERLLGRSQSLARRVGRIAQELTGATAARRETLLQVVRLATAGYLHVAARFEQGETETADIIAALRRLNGERGFLRPHRDWLYCTLLEWDPVLREWDGIDATPDDERLWRMLDRAYRFLAPRYMTVQEWQAAQPKPAEKKTLVW